MGSISTTHSVAARIGGRLLFVGLILGALLLTTMTAAAGPRPSLIVLPGAHSAEGIAMGRGSTFYAGGAFQGDIYRGDLQRGTAELFIDAREGRMALGMKVDAAGGLLFVAGGFTGQGYVYNTATGETVGVYQFADPATGPIINDVAVTRDGAWFTDSAHPQLYFVPVGPGETLGAFRTLTLTGPAAVTPVVFNLNGIAATPNGATLIVAHSGTGGLYTVNPGTGASALIAGVSVPDVDGILLEAGRLWAVQNARNQISTIRLSPDLTSGIAEPDVITNPLFKFPTTVARHGSQLAVVNAKLDTGFPPTAAQYEIIVVDR